MELSLTYLGTYWPHHGNLYFAEHEDGREARVLVDALGETWVDIRRVPDGGYFHTERVESYRAINGAAREQENLARRGFIYIRTATHAHHVRERSI